MAAVEKGVLTWQVARAWVMARGADMVPIPGTTAGGQCAIVLLLCCRMGEACH